MNLYGFVGNRPVNVSDRLGLYGAGWAGGPITEGGAGGSVSVMPRPQYVINSDLQALEHWHSNAGGEVMAGYMLILSIKSSYGYKKNKEDVETAISKMLESVSCGEKSGKTTRQGKPIGFYSENNAVGHITLVYDTYDVNWTASDLDSQCNRTVHGVGHRNANFVDEYNFIWEPETPIKTFFTDVIPGIIAGEGTPFNITGTLTDSVVGKANQSCSK